MKNEIFTADAVLHASELEDRCEYAPALSVFLTAGEQAELWRRVHYPHRLFFWGGFLGAERRCALFLPEWATEGAPYGAGVCHDSPEREAFARELIFGENAFFGEVREEIVLLSVEGSGHRELRHKDILGSVMALGITRQSVGDICMLSERCAVLALTGKLCPYVTGGLTKVGNDGVKVTVPEAPQEFTFERRFEEMLVTVASLRLDGVVSAVTGLSRTKAAELISAGLVKLSDTVIQDASAALEEGQSVTIRGYGKFLLSSTDGLTRKSRIRLTVKKYL